MITPLFAMINVHWYLPPLVIAISLVYSASRFEDWQLIWTHAIRWGVYILTFLAATYIALYLVSIDLLPFWVWIVALVVALLAYRVLAKTAVKKEPAVTNT